MIAQKEESRSSFLIKNLLRGLLWLCIILVAFIFTQEYILDNFSKHIMAIKDQPFIVFGVFFLSEVVFGIIPPVLFMSTWKLLIDVSLTEYIAFNAVLCVLSFVAGIIGYFIGKYFSKTQAYRRFRVRYLRQYNVQLQRYGVFLVLVGAVTPIPFSGTCMLAGSVPVAFRPFIAACAMRVFYYIIYGWVVWSFPELFL